MGLHVFVDNEFAQIKAETTGSALEKFKVFEPRVGKLVAKVERMELADKRNVLIKQDRPVFEHSCNVIAQPPTYRLEYLWQDSDPQNQSTDFGNQPLHQMCITLDGAVRFVKDMMDYIHITTDSKEISPHIICALTTFMCFSITQTGSGDEQALAIINEGLNLLI